MVGVGWMLVIDDWFSRGGSIGAMAGFLIGGLVLFPVAYVYGKLTEQIPDAGSEVAYTAAVFPTGVSFAAGWTMTFAYLIVCPYEAVSVGRILSYVFPQMNTIPLYSVGGRIIYLPHVIAGLTLTAVIVAINYRGVQISARFQNWTTFGLLAIFAVFSTLGLVRGSTANLQPLFARELSVQGGIVSILMVLQIVPYFLTGFEAAPKCSEEAAADFEPRHFTRSIYLALGMGIFFYVVVIGIVALTQPWQSLIDKPFPTAFAFERAFGSRLLVQFIMFGVFLSLLKIFNGNFLTATRLLFAMGRRRLVNERFAHIHERFQTPKLAVAFVGCLTVAASFLGPAVLVWISDVGSLASATGWFVTCLAFLSGAAGILSGKAKLVGSIGALVSALLILMKVLPFVPGSFGPFEFAATGGWALLGTILWMLQRGSLNRRDRSR